MIRLINRRLIIPQGDTGSFSIPTLGTIEEGDIAVLGIYDTLTHETILLKGIPATQPTLTFTFFNKDTINLTPKKYIWDITIYHKPEFDEDGIITKAQEVNSYYAAFKPPICEIRDSIVDAVKNSWNINELADDETEAMSMLSSIASVYPWENISLTFLAAQLFLVAQQSGYTGTREEFMQHFGSYLGDRCVEYMEYEDFPAEGSTEKLYFDLKDKVLYYWDNEYIPINAMLIEDTILNGGNAPTEEDDENG